MTKLYILFTRLYFSLLSKFWPSRAGEQAFFLFQKTRKLPLKEIEKKFYYQAKSFEIVHPKENVKAYEMGDPDGELVLLVHGWESNAGSMGSIAERLAAEGYRVVALDLPAHGQSSLTHTNLRESREVLRALIYQLRPKSFSVVSHSFGSAVTAFALAGTRYQVNNLIMLTSPNKLFHLFHDFAQMIGLNKTAFARLLDLSEGILRERVENLRIASLLDSVQTGRIVILHDLHDRVLPHTNAREIAEHTGAKLHTLENTGHYRMLSNPQVLGEIVAELRNSNEQELETEEQRSYHRVSA